MERRSIASPTSCCRYRYDERTHRLPRCPASIPKKATSARTVCRSGGPARRSSVQPIVELMATVAPMSKTRPTVSRVRCVRVNERLRNAPQTPIEYTTIATKTNSMPMMVAGFKTLPFCPRLPDPYIARYGSAGRMPIRGKMLRT